jgi:hypothetical protein
VEHDANKAAAGRPRAAGRRRTRRDPLQRDPEILLLQRRHPAEVPARADPPPPPPCEHPRRARCSGIQGVSGGESYPAKSAANIATSSEGSTGRSGSSAYLRRAKAKGPRPP